MTIKDILNRAAAESPERVSLRFKRAGEWQTRTFRELKERTCRVSEMLHQLGAKPGTRVAIYYDNSPEWYELYYGIIGLGAIAVPIDVKLREQEVGHICHDCGVSIVFCSLKNSDLIAEVGRKRTAPLEVIVLEGNDQTFPAVDGVSYHHYEQLRANVAEAASAEGRAFDRVYPDSDSPASFIYTSGTTGRQKGAVLTHANFIANVRATVNAIDATRDDNILLILPLHHSFAFTTTLLLPVFVQGQVSIVENLKTVKNDMKACSPTALLAVPLLLEKMIGRIMTGIEKKPLARLLYRFGLGAVVGKKVHEELGGKLRLIASGGAPISPETLRTWQRLGFTIVEGYGITETAPVLTLNPIERPRLGTVGLPLDRVEIKIHEPNGEGVGEIIARGPNVMLGYYNNPEETAKCLIDGWYYTGDLGYFDEENYLVISGRKKSLIVNREGKNIYPEEVEIQVDKSPFVLECLALGYREPGENVGERVGLIAVPDQDAFDELERQRGERLSEAQIEEHMRSEIRAQLEVLSDYKRPRRIQIRFDEFEKTTTQKIKRFLYAIDTKEA